MTLCRWSGAVCGMRYRKRLMMSSKDAEKLDTCMCDGGGGIVHTPSMRCTSGPYVELLNERDDLRNLVAMYEGRTQNEQ